jgi:transposase
VAFYADEVDIHLNPKIGPDWMLPGQQKVVVTPGQNVKRYLAGALDTRSGQLLWVADRHKRSGLFIDLVRHVVRRIPNARCIHLIVDNYSIHSSRQTRLALAELPQVRLHFLPPYSPDFNPIEREWRLLHAEVTRNHCCTTIDELMEQVRRHLAYRNRVKGLQIQTCRMITSSYLVSRKRIFPAWAQGTACHLVIWTNRLLDGIDDGEAYSLRMVQALTHLNGPAVLVM